MSIGLSDRYSDTPFIKILCRKFSETFFSLDKDKYFIDIFTDSRELQKLQETLHNQEGQNYTTTQDPFNLYLFTDKEDSIIKGALEVFPFDFVYFTKVNSSKITLHNETEISSKLLNFYTKSINIILEHREPLDKFDFISHIFCTIPSEYRSNFKLYVTQTKVFDRETGETTPIKTLSLMYFDKELEIWKVSFALSFYNDMSKVLTFNELSTLINILPVGYTEF